MLLAGAVPTSLPSWWYRDFVKAAQPVLEESSPVVLRWYNAGRLVSLPLA